MSEEHNLWYVCDKYVPMGTSNVRTVCNTSKSSSRYDVVRRLHIMWTYYYSSSSCGIPGCLLVTATGLVGDSGESVDYNESCGIAFVRAFQNKNNTIRARTRCIAYMIL